MESTHNSHALLDLAEAVSITRFWRNVQVGDLKSCWPWVGYTNKDGYGEFHFRGEMRGAHELALSFTTGEIKHSGMDTCHSCDNPPCCNPSHLRFDTRMSNVREMHERGRARIGNKRLTPEMVKLIRERRACGAPQKSLAAQYGISEAYVSTIVRGLAWPDAPGPIQKKNEQYRRSA